MSATLSIKNRSLIGSNACKKIRSAGNTPGIIYGEKQKPLSIEFSNEDFIICQRKKEAILNLAFDDKNSSEVIVQNIQYDAMGDNIIHVDFLRISAEKEITINVDVEFFGTPAGLSLGGITNIRLNKISVTCLPKDIPKDIRVNISKLNVSEQFRVADLPESENYKVNNHPETTLVIIRPPRKGKASAAEDKK